MKERLSEFNVDDLKACGFVMSSALSYVLRVENIAIRAKVVFDPGGLAFSIYVKVAQSDNGTSHFAVVDCRSFQTWDEVLNAAAKLALIAIPFTEDEYEQAVKVSQEAANAM